jgi:hypothetical protein
MAEKILKATTVREDCLNSLVNIKKDKKYSNIELSGAVDRYNFNNNDWDKLCRDGNDCTCIIGKNRIISD